MAISAASVMYGRMLLQATSIDEDIRSLNIPDMHMLQDRRPNQSTEVSPYTPESPCKRVGQHSWQIILKELGQLLRLRPLVLTQLQCQLHAITRYIVPVLQGPQPSDAGGTMLIVIRLSR